VELQILNGRITRISYGRDRICSLAKRGDSLSFVATATSESNSNESSHSGLDNGVDVSVKVVVSRLVSISRHDILYTQ